MADLINAALSEFRREMDAAHFPDGPPASFVRTVRAALDEERRICALPDNLLTADQIGIKRRYERETARLEAKFGQQFDEVFGAQP
jgi:hypothetical protein